MSFPQAHVLPTPTDAMYRNTPCWTGALVVALTLTACAPDTSRTGAGTGASASAPPITDASTAGMLQATVVTEPVLNDSDDPAIWLDTTDLTRSLVVGTDKGDTTGGLYVFRLDGTIDRERTRTPMKRTNNVDIVSGLTVGGRRIDVAVTTERGAQAIRVFRLPDMTPIDQGGIRVFDGDASRAPMGIALWRRPADGAVFAIVGGKSGPADGYLWQYRLEDAGNGTVRGVKVRAFGRYSGKKEIEAIAVDRTLGYVYYSDETVGIRQYRADPDAPDANAELALFGTSGFVSDHEGLAIYPTSDTTGYLLASDQQGQRLRVFSREGTPGAPFAHALLAVIPVDAMETDGLDVTARNLGPTFPQGMLVMMSTDRTFRFYDWRNVAARIARRDTLVTK